MKICLIGNNLTSLILAHIMSKKNLKSEIYSFKLPKNKFETRTLGITNKNLEYLSTYFNGILKKTNQINTIKVFIKNEKIDKEISFTQKSNVLFNMIRYDELLKCIKSKINTNRNISIKYIKKNHDLINISNKKEFDLIINCEKSNILTKKYLRPGITKNYFNKAFTTIIKHKKIKNNTATQIFTKFGPLAYLPLSDGFTSIVYSFDLTQKKTNEEEILKLIKRYNPLYKIESIKKIEGFNLMLDLPKKYYNQNILFFGDSIHSIHPLAGQGFNMTVRDIKRLMKIIDKKINLGLSLDKTIYREFEKEAKSLNSIFSIGIDFIHEYFKFDKKYIPKTISEKVFSIFDENRKLKNLTIKFVNQ